MKCLTDKQIQDYLENSIPAIEKSMTRDHLIVCTSCKQKIKQYKRIESILKKPVLRTPPEIIERNVLHRLFPMLPTYSSIFTCIALAFVTLISFIYIYFDFANNSIIQAFRLTSSNTSNWIASLIKGISNIFSFIYTIFNAINSMVEAVLRVNVGIEVVASLITFTMFGFVYFIYRFFFQRTKENHQ